MYGNRKFVIGLFSALLLTVAGCHPGGRNESAVSTLRLDAAGDPDSLRRVIAEHPRSIDAHVSLWRYYMKRGLLDSLTSAAVPLLAQTADDDGGARRLRHYAAAYIAQAKLLSGRTDSIDRYLNMLPDDCREDYFLATLIDNINAIHAMTVGADYGRAMRSLKRAEARLEMQRDTCNQVFVLCNITSLYISRQDTMGFDYARKAYRLGRGNPMTAAMSAMMLARLYKLKGAYDEALRYADEGARWIEGLDNKGLEAASVALYGELYCQTGDFDLAQRYCERALEMMDYADAGTQLNLLLSYGNVLRRMGRTGRAIALFERGHRLAAEQHNLPFDQAFLTSLAELYWRQNDRDEALRCYRSIYDYEKTLYSFNREREFTNLQIEISEMNHQLAVRQQELDRARIQRRATIVAAILFVCVMFILAGYFIYTRKNRMYRQLVVQHQALLKKIDDAKASEQAKNRTDAKTEKDLQLFERLEKVMRDELVYCQSDISLAKLADMLGTNKTYVSSVINTFAKMSFYDYINSYRIERAISILGNIDDTLIKTLAYDLGYNSLSAFYRAFKNATGCSPSNYKAGLKYIDSSAKRTPPSHP